MAARKWWQQFISISSDTQDVDDYLRAHVRRATVAVTVKCRQAKLMCIYLSACLRTQIKILLTIIVWMRFFSSPFHPWRCNKCDGSWPLGSDDVRCLNDKFMRIKWNLWKIPFAIHLNLDPHAPGATPKCQSSSSLSRVLSKSNWVPKCISNFCFHIFRFNGIYHSTSLKHSRSHASQPLSQHRRSIKSMENGKHAVWQPKENLYFCSFIHWFRCDVRLSTVNAPQNTQFSNTSLHCDVV